MEKTFDFGGWATKNNLRCSDGRTIMKNAFKDDNGRRVPLVWNHRHDSPATVLGHAILENREDGVYAYCSFNSTANGQDAKEQVKHGDINALSIFANNLKEEGKNVVHGIIREVSLVLAGANPGAFIDSVIVHADGSHIEDREQGIFYTGEFIELAHADDDDDENESDTNGETVQDIYDSFTDKQKVVMYSMLEEILGMDEEADDESDEDKEETTVKHNVFDKETDTKPTLAHSDEMAIVAMAKKPEIGSLKTAASMYLASKETLAHSATEETFYEALFPEVKDLNPGAPELITTDQGWIGTVLKKVHKSPMSRVRTRQVDVRDISKMRAKGYKKGAKKLLRGDPQLVHRTTDPQTVYVRSDLHRDDVVDITDFDVVNYMYDIDRMNLNEELAMAFMVGDRRQDDDPQKIHAEHIRPIWTDNELYTIHAVVDIAKMKNELQGTDTAKHFGEEFVVAEAVIKTLLNARKQFRGTAGADFYCTVDLINTMLLARDMNGRRIYDNVDEIRKALNVNSIVTCEQFEDQIRQDGTKKKKLLGLYVNLADYNVGATKGGEITHFTDFDLNFNTHQSLLETRLSGALTRVGSAIALEEDVTAANPDITNPMPAAEDDEDESLAG